RNYLCELCDKKFLTKGQLQKHQYAVHKANKSVECPICGMSFMDAKTLRNHSELHTRSKSHACDICDHSFV
ncbi:hypothetical protein CAPTEDRAFT_71785, partial [Capitella teleta]